MRLTREGWILIFFGILALSAFLRIFTPLTLLTSLVLLVIPCISIFWTIMSASGIRFARKLPEEGVAGEDIFATYRILNKSIFPAFGVRIEDKAIRGYIPDDEPYSLSGTSSEREKGFELGGFVKPLRDLMSAMWNFYTSDNKTRRKEFEEAYYKTRIQADFPIHLPPLWKNRPQEKSMRVKFSVRGFYVVGPVMITMKDPLGIFQVSFEIEGNSYILVLPKWSTLKRFPMGGSSRILRDENVPREREGWSPEFLGVREYQEGDPLKAVHWKLSAKHKQLIVKQFVQQVESSWGILLDLKKGSNAGKGDETSLEYMISITAAILEQLDLEKVPHVLVMAGWNMKIYEALRGERIFDSALRGLAACRNDSDLLLEERVMDLVERFPQLSWVLVTSRKDEDIISTVRALSSYGGKVMVTQVDMNSFLFESTEDELDVPSFLRRDAVEETHPKKERMSDTVKKWRRMWGEEMENFDGVIMSLGASYYQVNRGDNLAMIYF